ncbi:hypothetical protein F5B19DRAFT_490802 [Rostrohypoxylon terebratum]|nr:hypothetical protein F5B19DRAFT_490802 [Rostrohypoxylon terebratum]
MKTISVVEVELRPESARLVGLWLVGFQHSVLEIHPSEKTSPLLPQPLTANPVTLFFGLVSTSKDRMMDIDPGYLEKCWKNENSIRIEAVKADENNQRRYEPRNNSPSSAFSSPPDQLVMATHGGDLGRDDSRPPIPAILFGGRIRKKAQRTISTHQKLQNMGVPRNPSEANSSPQIFRRTPVRCPQRGTAGVAARSLVLPCAAPGLGLGLVLFFLAYTSILIPGRRRHHRSF